MSDVPASAGERIGLVIGSSLEANPFEVAARIVVTVAGEDGTPRAVTIDDCGTFVVLLRHGPDGSVPAHLVDHHANIRALCAAGCDRVVALGSGGGLHVDLGPGTLIAPDDFIAFGAYPTFHDTTDGYAVRGFDHDWRAEVVAAWHDVNESIVRDGGTYAMVRGPRFETKAEIRVLATFADVVGMTLPAECVLAAEAGLRYAAVCKIDNLANGVLGHELQVDEYRENARASATELVADLGRLLASLSPR